MPKFLPMLGHTRGNRSPVTCYYKCGNACAGDTCNTSDNTYFGDIADAAFSRRAALGLGGVAAGAIVVGHVVGNGATPAAADFGGNGVGTGTLPFEAIAPVERTVDTVTVPAGYDWKTLIRWGDPLFDDAPAFDGANQTVAAAEKQFGYNCDYLNVIAETETSGYLVCNHEYTNEEIMFDEKWFEANPIEGRKILIASHGFSVVEVQRDAAMKPWSYVKGGKRNRRITGTTPFTVDGPAAGSKFLQTKADPEGMTILGTLNNCAGGTTPWGTILSGEENFDQYFTGSGSDKEKRYGIKPESGWKWDMVDDRFDLNKNPNEAHRFGWIVEIDPHDPTSTPVKHTALGRFKHEGGNIRIADDGSVICYMGDDQAFDYVYKFVSKFKYNANADRSANKKLLSRGNLYVAKFNATSADEIDGSGKLPSDGAFDGSGEWIQLTDDKKSLVPGMSIEEVLVYTRLAADKMGATKMDRPEDVECSPVSGKVYMTMTKNSDRGGEGKAPVDEANPIKKNRDGHVIELTETNDDPTGTTFNWNILLVAGDPAVNDKAYFSGYPADKVSPISCPDNVAFDSHGNLWISTDGQPGSIGYCDALHKVTVDGADRGKVEQFLAVPAGAETCGPLIHDKDNMVFVAVQHPGEGGTYAEPISYFPDYAKDTVAKGDFKGPRPTVVQVFMKDAKAPTETPVTPKPEETKDPKDPKDKGPKDPKDKGPKDPKDKGPKDPKDKGPKDPKDKGPKGPKNPEQKPPALPNTGR